MKVKYLLFLLLGYTSCAPITENDLQIHVDAGEYDRHNTIVSFQVPDTLKHESYQLLDSQGNVIPVQIERQSGVFLLPGLNAGETLSLHLVPSKVQDKKGISVQLFQDAVAFSTEENRPVLQYRSGARGADMGDLDEIFQRGGYLHPVFSPNGHVVTGHYNPDRPHQNGIWSGWFRTEFMERNPDFWSPAAGTGSVDVYSLDHIWNGPVHGGIRARHHFTDNTTNDSTVILTDNWNIQVYNISEKNDYPVHIFDLDISQKNVSVYPFIISEWMYGGIGFRGNDSWLGEENTRLLTSEGKTRVDGEPVREIWADIGAHQSRAHWAYISGNVDGESPGIAILVHPENERFPEPIFMNLREPFFMFSPAIMGDILIEPGDALRLRYRYVVMDGEPSPEYLESLWQDYAYPVAATFD